MKRHFRRTIALVIGAGVLVLAVAPTNAEPLSSDGAVAEALRNNPELRALMADVEGAEGGVITARTLANPELSVEPGVIRSTDAGSADTRFHGTFSLTQLFEFPGKRKLKIALAERDVELREIAREGYRFQLANEVRRVFYELQAAEQILELRGRQVIAAEEFLKNSQERTERGYSSAFETVKGRSELVAAKRAIHESKTARAEARIALNTLMGRDPETPLTAVGEIRKSFPHQPAETLRELALSRNPSLRIRYAEAERAGLQLQAVRLGRRSDFAIGPVVETTPNEQIYGIGVTIALPLWDKKKGEIATAAAKEERTLAEIEKERRQIAGAVATAAEKLEIEREQLRLYSPDFLDELEGFVEQAEKQYNESTTTLLVYLDAKRTYYDTLSDYYQTLTAIAAAQAALEAAVGAPLDSNE